jgi:hypothetical protein
MCWTRAVLKWTGVLAGLGSRPPQCPGLPLAVNRRGACGCSGVDLGRFLNNFICSITEVGATGPSRPPIPAAGRTSSLVV